MRRRVARAGLDYEGFGCCANRIITCRLNRSGLVVRTLQQLQTMNPGFDTQMR
jgi:hypothetical protein